MKNLVRQMLALATVAVPMWTEACEVDVTQEPLVQSIGADEFRLAFGLAGVDCFADGCRGSLAYRVYWIGDRGHFKDEEREVAYVIQPGGSHSLAIDRQYFHEAESGEVISLVDVRITAVSCATGLDDAR